MTALAHSEVIVAKRALAVMTGRAALAAAAGVMIQRLRRRNLSSLWHARADLMTVVAVGFWIMLGVTESNPECRHVLRRA